MLRVGDMGTPPYAGSDGVKREVARWEKSGASVAVCRRGKSRINPLRRFPRVFYQ